MSIIYLKEYQKVSTKERTVESSSISIPTMACETRKGFGVALSVVSGGDIFYFRSKNDFLTAYADAAFHGKSVLAYAEERVAVDTYEEAVRQLKDNSL